jgi:uncharacterized membrane protein YoaK (UPF0700 family)
MNTLKQYAETALMLAGIAFGAVAGLAVIIITYLLSIAIPAAVIVGVVYAMVKLFE